MTPLIYTLIGLFVFFATAAIYAYVEVESLTSARHRLREDTLFMIVMISIISGLFWPAAIVVGLGLLVIKLVVKIVSSRGEV